jgi:fructan beta-fructosidase
LRVLVYACSVEVLANDGAAVPTTLVFPEPECQGVSLFTEGGEVRVCSARAWPVGGSVPLAEGSRQ